MIRQIADLFVRPRARLTKLVHAPAWVTTWAFILIVWTLCGVWLLSTDVGRQALVDERVRVVEVTGGTVSDTEYAALQQEPPWLVYFTSGGRLLLMPPVTLLVAAGLWAVARREGQQTSWSQAMSIVVHASLVLLFGQLIATPLHYIAESLTSPLNLAAILPGMDAGTAVSRFFGTLDLFALWWAGLLAVGLSALTGRPVRRYAWPIAIAFVGFAATVAAAIAVLGGA